MNNFEFLENIQNKSYINPDELTNNEIILTQSPKAYLRWLKLFTPEVHKKLTIKIWGINATAISDLIFN